MSMLAERKRKQKWCLNPRGKDWSEDSSKFGQKLLEKMGWSKGKGLGVNEDGITEHVKVSIKNDNKGMGFKEDQDPWTGNEMNFSNLLKDLSAQNEYTSQLGSSGTSGNSQCNEILKIQSLEKKSQSSRARVHYRKFTRGKDLSQYSNKDLANIFGKPSLKIESATTRSKGNKSDEDQVTSTTNCEEIDSEMPRNLIPSGSTSTEYFEKKIASKRPLLKIPSTVTSSDVIEDSISSDIDTAASTSADVVTTTSPNTEESKILKKKKKKTSTSTASTEDDGSTPDSSQEVVTEETNYYVETKKDRKKRNKFKNDDSLKIMLKKKHTYDNPGLNINDSGSSNEVENNFGEVTRTHHKKKKLNGIENPALELSGDESPPPKKKKRRTTFVSYINTDISLNNATVNTLTVKSVPKKRKRSHSVDEDKPPAYDNPTFNHNTDSDDTDDVANVIHKIIPELQEEKKARKLKGICNYGLDDSSSLSSVGSPSPKRKQRRKQKEVMHYDVVYNSEPNTPKSALKKKSTMIKPRKSVQINESINQEKFITDESENSHEGGCSTTEDDDDETNLSITKRIDDYQNELENSLNEKKCVKDNTSKKFKNIALKKLTQRRVSIEFPGVKHESIIKGYGVKD